MNNSH